MVYNGKNMELNFKNISKYTGMWLYNHNVTES